MLLICYVVAGTVKFSAIFQDNHLTKINNKTNNPTDFQHMLIVSGVIVPQMNSTGRVGNIKLFRPIIVAVECPKK